MIECSVEAAVVGVGVLTPVVAEMAYDPEVDAYGISVVFVQPVGEDVHWSIGRELLIRGATSDTLYGDGDVKLKRAVQEATTELYLTGPEGTARVLLNEEQLIDFLSATTELVPVGEEDMEGAVDEALEEIFNS